jgi:hypothetical protein
VEQFVENSCGEFIVWWGNSWRGKHLPPRVPKEPPAPEEPAPPGDTLLPAALVGADAAPPPEAATQPQQGVQSGAKGPLRYR